MFCDFFFSLKHVFTPLTLHCPKCLFHMDNHTNPVSQCHTHEIVKWIHMNIHGESYLQQAMYCQICAEYFKKKKRIQINNNLQQIEVPSWPASLLVASSLLYNQHHYQDPCPFSVMPSSWQPAACSSRSPTPSSLLPVFLFVAKEKNINNSSKMCHEKKVFSFSFSSQAQLKPYNLDVNYRFFESFWGNCKKLTFKQKIIFFNQTWRPTFWH